MNLLLTGSFTYTESQLEALASLGYHITFVQDECQPLEIEVENLDAVVCNSLFQNNDISRFKSLKFIQLTSAGRDRVPVEYIREKGICLETARGVYSIPIAEWVLGKILEIYKHSGTFYVSQQKKTWHKERGLMELTGKTVAILGFGSIGMETARRLKPFGVRLVAVDNRQPAPEDADLADDFYSTEMLNQVLAAADIIVLTLPLNGETRHLINAETLSLMKEHAVLVNVSRGGIIDEPALVAALKEGKFAGVALDVFEEEPLPADSPLWTFPNLLVTPHNAFVSENNPDRLFRLIHENLKIAISNFSKPITDNR